jgi:glycosyltransferase involved in cell wall biosynthesis
MIRVSVITAVYNSERTLAPAIDSGLAQAFDDFELIAVNDCSTDASAAILSGYGDRIRIVHRDVRGGCSGAWNSGIRAARGAFIAFLDADDVWMPAKLARTVPLLESDPACVLAFSNATMVEDGGMVRGAFVPPGRDHAPALDEMLRHWWPIVPSTAVIRRAAYDGAGGFFEAPGVYKACEDVFMWLRLRELGHFRYVPEPLVRYRVLPYPDYLTTYDEGRKVLYHLIAERYGAAGRRLIGSIQKGQRREHVNRLGHLGLIAMRDGRNAEARQNFVRALHYDPLSVKNALRLARTFLPAPMARALSGRTRRA